MGGLIQPAPSTEQSESNWRPILLGVGLVVIVVGAIAFFLREAPKNGNTPHPYAANIKLSDLKMSAAENFVGASVTYLDGTVTNSGDKTLTHAIVHVTFKDSLGHIVQTEDIPLHVLQTGGPYPKHVHLFNIHSALGLTDSVRPPVGHVSSQ